MISRFELYVAITNKLFYSWLSTQCQICHCLSNNKLPHLLHVKDIRHEFTSQIINIWSQLNHWMSNYILLLYFTVYNIYYNISNIYYNISNIYYNISNIYYNISNIYYNISNIYYNISNIYYNISNIYYNISYYIYIYLFVNKVKL